MSTIIKFKDGTSKKDKSCKSRKDILAKYGNDKRGLHSCSFKLDDRVFNFKFTVGRKKSESQTVAVTLRIDEDILKFIDERSNKLKVSKSEVIREALRYFQKTI